MNQRLEIPGPLRDRCHQTKWSLAARKMLKQPWPGRPLSFRYPMPPLFIICRPIGPICNLSRAIDRLEENKKAHDRSRQIKSFMWRSWLINRWYLSVSNLWRFPRLTKSRDPICSLKFVADISCRELVLALSCHDFINGDRGWIKSWVCGSSSSVCDD